MDESSLLNELPSAILPQTSYNKKNWVTVIIVLIFLIIGGYCVFSELQNLWPFNSPVAVKPNLSLTSTPTLYSQMYNTSSNNKFYIQTWSNTPANSRVFEVYEINDGQLQKIFSKTEDQVEAVSILGVIPEGLLIIEREYGYSLPTKLSLYNTGAQKSETLLELTRGHSLVASLSPDRNQVIFSDHHFFARLNATHQETI